MNFSVVIVSHRRKKSLEKILNAWLFQVPDVWLCDCGVNLETRLPVKTVKFNQDPGSKSRHAIALLTEGDFIFKADDDVMPLPGFVNDIYRGWQAVGDGIVGIIGRKFEGESYYMNTRFYAANKLSWNQLVDFVGVITMSPRKYLPFDLKGCQTPIEDLFWQMKAYRDVPKYVIQTKNYVNLPESHDKDCLFHDQKAREVREIFYREYYLKSYKNGS